MAVSRAHGQWRASLLSAVLGVTVALTACDSPAPSESGDSSSSAEDLVGDGSPGDGAGVNGEGSVVFGAREVTFETADNGEPVPVRVAPAALNDETHSALLDLVSIGAAVSSPVNLSTPVDPFPEQGATLTRTYDEPLPPEASASFAFYDANLLAWVPVESTLSEDRRTLSAQVNHFSLWTDVYVGTGDAYEKFVRSAADKLVTGSKALANDAYTNVQAFNAYNLEKFTAGSEWLFYQVGDLVSVRAPQPDCDGAPPAWVERAVFIEFDRNNPLHYCAGSNPEEPDQLQIKVSISRGYAYTVGTAVEPASTINSAYDQSAFERAIKAVGDLDAELNNSLISVLGDETLVPPGETVTLNFDEETVRFLEPSQAALVTVAQATPATIATTIVANQIGGAAEVSLGRWVAAVTTVAGCLDGVNAETKKDGGVLTRMPATMLLIGQCFGDRGEFFTRAYSTVLLETTDLTSDEIAARAERFKRILGRALAWGVIFSETINYQLDAILGDGAREVTIITTPKAKPTVNVFAGGSVDIDGTDSPAAAEDWLKDQLGEPDEIAELNNCFRAGIKGELLTWGDLNFVILTEEIPDGITPYGFLYPPGAIAGWTIDLDQDGNPEASHPITVQNNPLPITLDELNKIYTTDQGWDFGNEATNEDTGERFFGAGSGDVSFVDYQLEDDNTAREASGGLGCTS